MSNIQKPLFAKLKASDEDTATRIQLFFFFDRGAARTTDAVKGARLCERFLEAL